MSPCFRISQFEIIMIHHHQINMTKCMFTLQLVIVVCVLHVQAETCSKDTVLQLPNSDTKCTVQAEEINCKRTCKSRTYFKNGDVVSNSQCIGENNWTGDDRNADCLVKENTVYAISVKVKYSFPKPLSYCYSSITNVVKTNLESSSLNTTCRKGINGYYKLQVGEVTARDATITSLQADITIQLIVLDEDEDQTELTTCSRKLQTFVLFKIDASYCGDGRVLKTTLLKSGETCSSPGFSLLIVTGSSEKICLPCSPGSFFNERTESCQECSKDEYQNTANQRSCIKCPVNQLSISPRSRYTDCTELGEVLEGSGSGSGGGTTEGIPRMDPDANLQMTVTAVKGQTINLFIKVLANPAPTFTWRYVLPDKTEKSITDFRFTITDKELTSKLTIEDVTDYDYGGYIVYVTNSLATRSMIFRLVQKHLPVSPSNDTTPVPECPSDLGLGLGVGIVIGMVVAAVIVVIVWFITKKRNKDTTSNVGVEMSTTDRQEQDNLQRASGAYAVPEFTSSDQQMYESLDVYENEGPGVEGPYKNIVTPR